MHTETHSLYLFAESFTVACTSSYSGLDTFAAVTVNGDRGAVGGHGIRAPPFALFKERSPLSPPTPPLLTQVGETFKETNSLTQYRSRSLCRTFSVVVEHLFSHCSSDTFTLTFIA